MKGLESEQSAPPVVATTEPKSTSERAKLFARQVMSDVRENCKEMDRDLVFAVMQDELARAFYVGYASASEDAVRRGRK